MGFVNYLRATGSYYSARFHKGEEGAVATEYGFLIVFIALAITVGAMALGGALDGLFSNAAETVTTDTEGAGSGT